MVTVHEPSGNSTAGPNGPPPAEPTPLGRVPGSPFVVGRPLRAGEPIFGRQAAFRFIDGELTKFSSVNIVGERRMGKTSLLNHLVGRQDQYLTPRPDQAPPVLACLDLQGGVSNQARFYGIALRELLDHLPPSRSAEAKDLREWLQRLHADPQVNYHEFERALKTLRDRRGVCVRPVLIVDEFERLIEPAAGEGFPYPDFFNGVRALITADLLAMVVASRLPLADYFRDPSRPGSLTSTFPSYLTPFTLSSLDDAAADALLLQPGDRRLTLQEVSEARRWAGGHPCHLQVAGQAWYEARTGGHEPRWARRRFHELKSQNCMTGARPTPPFLRPEWLRRTLRVVFWETPLRVGRLAQRLGLRLDELAAWIIGAVIIILLLLLLLGVAQGSDLLDAIKKGLGL